jgi:hypothetical protein
MKYSVAGVEVELLSSAREIEAPEGVRGVARVAIVSTPDLLKAEVLIRDFGPDHTEVKLTEFLATEPPLYSHLIRNGVMTVQRLENGDWVAPLRALRPGGRTWPTLNFVSLDELSKLLDDDALAWLEGLGFTVGTWGELNPAAKKFKQSVAVSIASDKSRLIVLPWVLTRVVALMKKLGASKVVDA